MKRLFLIAAAVVSLALLLAVGPAAAAHRKPPKKKVVPTTVNLTAAKAPDGTVTGTIELASPDPRCLGAARIATGPVLQPKALLGFGPLTGTNTTGASFFPPDPTLPAEGTGKAFFLAAVNSPGGTEWTFQGSLPGSAKTPVTVFDSGGNHQAPQRTVGEAEDLGITAQLNLHRVPFRRHGRKFMLICPEKRVAEWLTIAPE